MGTLMHLLLIACTPQPLHTALAEDRIDLSGLPRNLVDEADIDGVFDVWFTEPGIESDPDADSPLDDAAIALIEATTASLDLALYEFDEAPIYEAVLAAHERGVLVRMVGDGDEEHDEGYQALLDAGVEISMRKPGDRIMHDKYILADGQVLWTGSTNLSANGTHRNNNNAVLIESAELVEEYQADFDQMFEGSLFGRHKEDTNNGHVFDFRGYDLDLYFSPQHDPIDELVALVDEAERSVRFMVFSYTHPDLRDAMLRAHDRGVAVYGIYDESQGYGAYSTDEALAAASVPVWIDGNDNASGFSGGKLHHKVLIVDGELVVTGSFNWSKSATLYNDENLIVLREPAAVELFEEEFCDRLAEATLHEDHPGDAPRPCSTPAEVALVLNEVLPHPSEGGVEFVEIVNIGDADADLSGWTLGDLADSRRHAFEDRTLVAGDALVVSGTAATSGRLSLNHTGDVFALYNADGAIHDLVAWARSTQGVSLNRPDDGAAGAGLVPHDEISDLDQSPGTRADGTPWL